MIYGYPRHFKVMLQFYLPPVQLLKPLDLVGLKLKQGKSELDLGQDIQSLELRENVTPRIQGSTRLKCSNPLGSLFWASGLSRLSIYLRPLPRHFLRADQMVYITVSLRPISPCHPPQALAGPIFSCL